MSSDVSDLDKLKQTLIKIKSRIDDKTVPPTEVLTELNSLQRFINPKNLDTYLPMLNTILDILFAIRDDKDVSIRHISSVILDSSVQVVLPFQKSPILQYISMHASDNYSPHALVSMIELSLKVALFLTHSVILDLFAELTHLLEVCSEHSSEIVAENFNRMAPQIRQFVESKEVRLNLIRLLGQPKDSVLSARWGIKTAAIFAYPDLIEDALPYIPQKMYFLANMPKIQIKDIPIGATFEEILPFVEQNPNQFTEMLQTPPTDHSQIAPYLLCLKNALPYGFKPSFDLSILTNISREPNISALQYECIALGVLSESFSVDLKEIFTETIPSIISAYTICFNKFPSLDFLEAVLVLDTESPVTAKSVVGFLCEVDFTKFPTHVRRSADKIALIANSGHEMVQKQLCEKCPHFNNGDVYPLYQRFLGNADFFDANSFKNICAILSSMSCPRVDDLTNSFFSILTEIDGDVIWGDVGSLEAFLVSLKRFCMHSRLIRIPQYIASLPELVLYAIACFVCAQPPHFLTRIANNFLSQNGHKIASILSKQPQSNLLSLRDIAAAAAGALKSQVVMDLNSFDALGRKLIPWPSANTWLLLSSSAKAHVETTSGILSADPKIVFAAAQIAPEKLPKVNKNSLPDLIVLAIERGDDIDFEVDVPLIKAADRRKVFPQIIADKITNSWMAIAIKKHFELDCVKELVKKPFRDWEGPPAFWQMVPYFVARLITRGVKIDFSGDLPAAQKFTIAKNVRIFRKVVKPSFITGLTVKKQEPEEYDVSLDEEVQYVSPEILRALRMKIYQTAKVEKFTDLLKAQKISVSPAIIAMAHNELSRDASDCAYDLLMLNIELAAAVEDCPKTDASLVCQMSSFSKYWIEMLINKVPWAPNRPQEMDTTERIFTETELFAIAKYAGLRNVSTIYSPITTEYQSLFTSYFTKFRRCIRHNKSPSFSFENEQRMVQFVAFNGVSRFAIKTIKEWISAGNKPFSLTRFISGSCLSEGTYFPIEFIDMIKVAVKDKEIKLQILANVQIAPDSTLKKIIEKIISQENQ